MTGRPINPMLPHLQPQRPQHVAERRRHLVAIPGALPVHLWTGSTTDRIPQDRQRPYEPRHRVRPLHAPLTPDPRVVQAQVLLAVEECKLDAPPPAVSLDDERRRDLRVG